VKLVCRNSEPYWVAELDLDQIWSLVDGLIAAHGDWLPGAARHGRQPCPQAIADAMDCSQGIV
jgi:hypothetical protein